MQVPSARGQLPSYYSASQTAGGTTQSKPPQLSQQMMGMQPLHLRPPNLVEGGRTVVEQQAHRPGGMVPGPSVGGLHSFQQNMPLLPNGANLLGGGIVGQQNPTGSPLRHFSHPH